MRCSKNYKIYQQVGRLTLDFQAGEKETGRGGWGGERWKGERERRGEIEKRHRQLNLRLKIAGVLWIFLLQIVMVHHSV